MKHRIISAFLCAAFILSSAALFARSSRSDSSAELTSDLSSLDLTEYDVRKYVAPFWRTNVIWNECFYPLINNNGTYRPIKLMYRADEIVSVRDYTLSKEYVRGRDYDLNEDGELVFVDHSRIPKANDFAIHSPVMPRDADESTYYPRWDGDGYEYWNESSEISLKTVAVTYVTSDGDQPERPASLEGALPRSFEKLASGDDFHMVLLGDSVGTGAKSSGNCGIAPYADAYPAMTEKALALKFGNPNVKLTNSAIGGTTSEYTEAKLDETVIKFSPDLVVINFGMNDSSYERVGYTDERFLSNMTGQIEYIKEKLPETEILLVSSLLGNPYTFREERYVSHAAILSELAAKYDGVGFCDPQAIERFYLRRKEFIDFMADNMVHPNDLGMRLIAQTITDAFRFEDAADYAAIELEKLREAARLDENSSNGRYALLAEAIGDARREMSECADEWEITDVFERYSERVATILRQCAPEDHVFEARERPARCDADGSYYKLCTVCGYSEDTEPIAALGGEHIWDSGFVSVPSGYRAKGTLTYTCRRCALTRNEAIPELSDGEQTLDGRGMLHVSRGYNYMESSLRPFVKGDATVELDICPLNTNMGHDGVSYAGLWIGNYSISAAYNFTKQRFEIVDANLPYSFVSGEFKVAPYEWRSTKDSGSFNWHKLAVNLKGDTVSIYLDGVKMIEDTNERYSRNTSDKVIVFYTIGEFYLDNFRVSRGGYDPTSGEGDVIFESDLDGEGERGSFIRHWSYGNYTKVEFETPTDRTRSSALYANHVHTLTHAATVESGCANCGAAIFECTECGARVVGETAEPRLGEHAYVPLGESAEGERTVIRYACAYCDMTFTEVKESASPRLAVFGDVNGDRRLNARDAILVLRSVAGGGEADVTGDGETNARDAIAIMRVLTGHKLAYPS